MIPRLQRPILLLSSQSTDLLPLGFLKYSLRLHTPRLSLPQDFPPCSSTPLPCSQYFGNFSTGFFLLWLGKCGLWVSVHQVPWLTLPLCWAPPTAEVQGSRTPFADCCACLFSRTVMSTQNRRAATSTFPSDLPSSQSSKCWNTLKNVDHTLFLVFYTHFSDHDLDSWPKQLLYADDSPVSCPLPDRSSESSTADSYTEKAQYF